VTAEADALTKRVLTKRLLRQRLAARGLHALAGSNHIAFLSDQELADLKALIDGPATTTTPACPVCEGPCPTMTAEEQYAHDAALPHWGEA
jgi:hypothetical protein